MQLIDGKQTAALIKAEIAKEVESLVKDGMRRLIVSGVLPAGSKISSVREMASGLAINPSTIQRAYRELEAEGYISSQPGKGSFVCARGGVDESRKAELLGKFDELVTELGYVGVDRQMLADRLKGE